MSCSSHILIEPQGRPKLRSIMAFEPAFEGFLDYLGVPKECRTALLRDLRITDWRSLQTNRDHLHEFTVEDANNKNRVPPSLNFSVTARVLLKAMEYVDLLFGDGVSSDLALQQVFRGHDFLYWLATGESEVAPTSSSRRCFHSKNKNKEDAPRKRKRSASGIDMSVTPSDLDVLREFIREKQWEYEDDNKTFALRFGDEGKVNLPEGFFKALFDYQRDGIEWLLTLYGKRAPSGAVLADDMGLGKSIQSLTVAGMLMRAGIIKNALIIAPKTVAYNWEKEANKWLPMIKVPNLQIDLVTSDTKEKERRKILREALRASKEERNMAKIVIAPFTVVTMYTKFFKETGCRWGLLILDEAHQVKNPNTQQSNACKLLCSNWATYKLLLTGTPIPNRLMELWTLTNMYISKDLLGKEKDFKEHFVKPIESAHENSSLYEKRQAEKRNGELQEIMGGFVLRRTKEAKLTLPKKTINVLWYNIGAVQRQLYEECTADFSSKVGESENATNSQAMEIDKVGESEEATNGQPMEIDNVETGETIEEPQTRKVGKEFLALQHLTRVRRICAHPLLVQGHDQKELKDVIEQLGVENVMRDSPKMEILSNLVARFTKDGHLTLICSQYTSTLNLVDFVLRNSGHKIARIDGQTPGKKRIAIANDFNEGKYNAMLLSTKAGGVGINLVGASRVVIFDPDWTPANDSQAMDRAHRPGQERKVEVYFLIAAGTVEEKMLEIQMHKEGLHNTVLSTDNRMKRLYEKHDPSDLFRLSPKGVSKVFEKLQAKGETWDNAKVKAFVNHPDVHGISSWEREK